MFIQNWCPKWVSSIGNLNGRTCAEKKRRENEHHTWLINVHNGKYFRVCLHSRIFKPSPHIFHHSMQYNLIISNIQSTLKFLDEGAMPANMPGQTVAAASKPQRSSSSERIINKDATINHILIFGNPSDFRFEAVTPEFPNLCCLLTENISWSFLLASNSVSLRLLLSVA